MKTLAELNRWMAGLSDVELGELMMEKLASLPLEALGKHLRIMYASMTEEQFKPIFAVGEELQEASIATADHAAPDL